MRSVKQLLKKKNYQKYVKLGFALSNPHRRKILKILLKEDINITNLTKKIGISYANVISNLNVLEEVGLVNKTKIKTMGGNATIVSLKNKVNK